MFSTNLQTLKIHKLTQEQYERELNAGRIDSNALYLTEDKEQDLSYYATKAELANYAQKTDLESLETTSAAQAKLVEAKAYADGKAPMVHSHDSAYDVKGAANTALENAKTYVGEAIKNFITSSAVDSKISSHNVNTSAHNDIRTLITTLTNRFNALANSDDETLDQLSEIVAYIKSNKNLIDSVTTSKVNVSDIINNLTTNVSNKPLSAAQGVAIKTLIDGLTVVVNGKADKTHSHNYAGADSEGGNAYNALKLQGYAINPNSPIGSVPVVRADGVMEIGQYIDFHNSNENKDYDARIASRSDGVAGLELYGTTSGVFQGSLEGNATSATTASSLSNAGTLTTSESINNFITGNRLQYALFQLQSDIGVGFTSNDGMLLSIPWNSTKYGAQIAIDDNTTNPKIAIRAKNSFWGDWKTLPFSDGTNASGTWGINITGNAGSATKLATSRTISLTGSVTGSGSFDGSGNLSIATTSNHNHDGSYVNVTGDNMSGKLVLDTTIKDHAQPVDQALVINAGSGVPSGTTLSLKNAPGIGFHVGNVSWASMVFDGTFHFINSAASGHVPIRAADIQGTTGTFSSNVSIGGNLTLDGKLSSYSISPRFYSDSISTAGWYRVFTSANANSTGKNGMFLTIGRSYNSPQNEEYVFSINVGYNGDISITQLSGVMGGNLIKKIRVLWSNSGIFYIDFYTEYKNYTNTYYVYGIGEGTFCNPTGASIPSGWSSYEFTTTAGCKSDRGFVGNLAGNATTASSAVGVQDYNKISRVIKIGYEGSSAPADQIKFIAAYISDTQIKDITKATLQSWLGLGSAAYTASTDYATSGHSHTYLPTYDIKEAYLYDGFWNSFRTSVKGSSSNGTFISVLRSNSDLSGYAKAYGTGLSWGKDDTHGYLYLDYSNDYAVIGAGSSNKINWLKRLSFSDHTHSYLPLSGGTMTGNIRVPGNVGIIQNQNSTSNYTSPILWYKGGTSQATYDPQIGQHNTGGDGNGSICILPYATTSEPWQGSVGLYITKGSMKLDGKEVITANNIGSQSVNYASSAGSANYANSAGSANYAIYDQNGNTINSTYATKTELSGKVEDFNGEAYNLTIAGESQIIYDIHMNNGVKFCAKSLNDKSTSLIYLSTGDNVLINHSAYTNRDVRNVYSYVPWNDSKAAAYGIYGVANGNQSKTNTLVKTGYNTSNVAYINIPPAYNGTTSDAANVFVSSAGKLSRSTSASKYKLNISPINEEDVYAYNILKLNPKQWHDKASIERYSDLLTRESNGEVLSEDDLIEKDTINIDTRYGLIAEDVEAAGLDKYCSYELDIENNTKELEGIQYDRVATLLIPVVRDLVLYTQKTAKYIHVDEMSEDDRDEIANLLTRINSFKESEIIK